MKRELKDYYVLDENVLREESHEERIERYPLTNGRPDDCHCVNLMKRELKATRRLRSL